ncbi:MAG: ABC transporter ATP-binding protein [Phycisphaerales bacterium]
MTATQPQQVTETATAGLVIRGLSFSYPGRRRRAARQVLHGIDLDIAPGQTVAILGPNGSGKSTLIKIICSILVPDAGSVEVFGASRPADIRPRVSVVFQSDGLDPHLTVYENLRDQACLYGIPRREAKPRITQQLKEAGLTDRRRDLVKTLSRGLARRVDLARAMLHRPKLLLLDEPTVGLDPVAREAFLQMVEREQHADGERIVLLSTHLIDEADRCDRVVLLHQGGIVADGPPTTLREELGERRVTVFNTDTQSAPSLCDLAWERTAGGWSALLDPEPDRVKVVVAKLANSGLAFTIAPPTLADVFEHHTGAQLDLDTGVIQEQPSE